MEKDFTECDACLRKPGSPILCKGCLSNREYISSLEKELDKNRDTLEVLEKIIKLIK